MIPETERTVEPGEPLHDGKVGGHSVWISWQAPDHGLVSLGTGGSSFDTLPAVYRLDGGNRGGSQFPRLEEVTANDDYGGFRSELGRRSYGGPAPGAGNSAPMSVTGINFIIQTATSLPPQWVSVATNVVPASGVVSVTNPIAGPSQFFRVMFP